MHNKRKIALIGDSHARGFVEYLIYHIGTSYEVTGYVNQNADLRHIYITTKEETESLTNNVVLILCVGSRYIGKNVSTKGRHYVKHFVENRRNNVMIVSALHRFDLSTSSF